MTWGLAIVALVVAGAGVVASVVAGAMFDEAATSNKAATVSLGLGVALILAAGVTAFLAGAAS